MDTAMVLRLTAICRGESDTSEPHAVPAPNPDLLAQAKRTVESSHKQVIDAHRQVQAARDSIARSQALLAHLERTVRWVEGREE